MESINPHTTHQEQDTFILDFLTWLNNNYSKNSDNQYYDPLECYLGEMKRTYLTAAECLAEYRRRHTEKPSLTFDDLEKRMLAFAEAVSNRNRILFNGFQKLHSLLLVTKNVSQNQVADIIKEVHDQIANS